MADASTWAEGIIPVLDYETTGVDPFADRPVSVAALWVEPGGRAMMRGVSCIIDAGVEVPEGAAAVHGITTEMVKAKGQPAEEAAMDLATYIEEVRSSDVPLVIYNAGFDWPMLVTESARFGIGIEPVPLADPRLLDRHLDPYRRGGRRLETVCEFYGVKLDNAHDAKSDCLASVEVLRAIARKYPQIGAMTPWQLHEYQRDVAWPSFRDGLNAWYRRKGITGKDITGPWIATSAEERGS